MHHTLNEALVILTYSLSLSPFLRDGQDCNMHVPTSTGLLEAMEFEDFLKGRRKVILALLNKLS